MTSRIDDFGGPKAYNHYAVGWAHAMDTPFQWTKQVASHSGRHTQRHDRALAERHQQEGRGAHAVPPRHRRRRDHPRRGRPARAHLRPWDPADAVARRLDDPVLPRRVLAGAPPDAVLRDVLQPRHLPRGLDGRDASQHSCACWAESPPLDADVWELYGPDDWTQANDLAAEQPDKLRELQTLFLIEAAKYNVLPLDDRRADGSTPISQVALS